MRVLITYGSKRSGTAGLAEMLAKVLRDDGLDVDVDEVGDAFGIDEYDAVIVGGALYAGRWHKEARRFVEHHAEALRRRPVWLFSSGPLDASADTTELSPTPDVTALMAKVGARGHHVFGGRLERDAKGFVAGAMAVQHSGDWRNPQSVAAWAKDVARKILASKGRKSAPQPVPYVAPLRGLLAGLQLVVGLGAVVGGAALVSSPSGALLGLPLSLLAHSPFSSYLVPGLLLMVVVGFMNVSAARQVWRNVSYADGASFISAGALTAWMLAQVVMLRSFNALQAFMLALGVSLQLLALWRAGRTRRETTPPPEARGTGGMLPSH